MPSRTFLGLLAVACLTGAADTEKRRLPDGERELHAVGLYEGHTRTGNQIHGGLAAVTVDRPGKRVTLCLSSQESVTWTVTVAPQSQVEKVILGGVKRQAVNGLPDGVEVEEAFGAGNGGAALSTGHRIDAPLFRVAVRELHRRTRLNLSSFQAAYRSEPNQPIVIRRVQDDPRLAAGYPRPTPLAELPKPTFQAVHLDGGQRPFFQAASFGEFTLAGPKIATLKALPHRVQHLAFDPETKKYYGLTGHNVAVVDLDRQTAQKLDLGLDVPALSWPCGITFDTKRGRLLVATLGGTGYLYSYVPKTAKWSVLADLNDVDLAGLTYDAKHDLLYGIHQPHGEEPRPVLVVHNPAGARLRSIPLPDPMLPGILGQGHGGASVQLVAHDGLLVLLIGPGRHGGREALAESLIYLVDPTAEKVWLASRR
jgi:hypothetical protein